jgi:excinuclease ABC subunit C
MVCRTKIIIDDIGFRTVEGQDDFASMAEVVRRRYSRVLLSIAETGNGKPESVPMNAAAYSQENALEIAERLTNPQSAIRNLQSYVRLPDLIIVDGGKGQLSAACRELQRLGLHDLPIIGLAKEHEGDLSPSGAGVPAIAALIPVLCVCSSASAMKHIVSPTPIINCS